MKSNFSHVDLSFVLKEIIPAATDAKISKIYQDSRDDFSFVLWNRRKYVVRIHFPGSIWLDAKRASTGQEPTNFSVFLRKRIEGGRILSVAQMPNERIVELKIEKNEVFFVYVELFSSGNLVLCDAEKNIIGASLQREWSARSTKKAEKYALPPKRKPKDDQNNSQFIASTLGYGKRWALEFCTRLDIDPKAPLDESTERRAKLLLTKLLKGELEPAVIDAKTVEPIALQSVQGERKKMQSFSEAIAQVHFVPEQESPKKQKLRKAIAIQEETVKKHRNDADKREQEGQSLYENYADVQALLTKAKKHKGKLKDLLHETSGKCTIIETSDKNRTIDIECE